MRRATVAVGCAGRSSSGASHRASVAPAGCSKSGPTWSCGAVRASEPSGSTRLSRAASSLALRGLSRMAMSERDDARLLALSEASLRALERPAERAAELRLCVRLRAWLGKPGSEQLLLANEDRLESTLWYALMLEAVAIERGDLGHYYQLTHQIAGLLHEPIERAAYALRAAETLEATAPTRALADLESLLLAAPGHPWHCPHWRACTAPHRAPRAAGGVRARPSRRASPSARPSCSTRPAYSTKTSCATSRWRPPPSAAWPTSTRLRRHLPALAPPAAARARPLRCSRCLPSARARRSEPAWAAEPRAGARQIVSGRGRSRGALGATPRCSTIRARRSPARARRSALGRRPAPQGGRGPGAARAPDRRQGRARRSRVPARLALRRTPARSQAGRARLHARSHAGARRSGGRSNAWCCSGSAPIKKIARARSSTDRQQLERRPRRATS